MVLAMQRARIWIIVAAVGLAGPLRSQESPASVTVLARGEQHAIEGATHNDGQTRGPFKLAPMFDDGLQLLIPIEAIASVHGLTLKPEGLCTGDLCLPVPPDAEWLVEDDEVTRFDSTAFARHVGQAFAHSADGAVWSFSDVPAVQDRFLPNGLAPDFTLPDRDGRPISLGDFRGKKVLLITWASW